MRIVKPGKVSCKHCGAVLEYGPADISTDGINAEMQGSRASFWIVCPTEGCRAPIDVQPFR